MNISRIESRSISDSRGNPTVETTLFAGDFSATASVPSGKSTGSHEAKELRDENGGVTTAIANVTEEIAAAIANRTFDAPDALDAFLIDLDGTPDKSHLGANAILSVSIAAQRLFAQAVGVPLWRAIAERANTTPSAPRLFVNCMEGGAHANFRLPFQEYLLVVDGPTSAALATARAAFTLLGEKLGTVSMGDEGGYAPNFSRLEEPFEILAHIVEAHPGVTLALDAAANELRNEEGYRLIGTQYSPEELAEVYKNLIAQFPIKSIEDPFSEDDAFHFTQLTAALGEKVLIVGDDFTVTNPTRIRDAATKKAINAVIIKPNQIGTVKEAIDAARATRAAGWHVICSHRSGETMDTFIADFAYGIGAYGIKAGGFAQSERVAKYNRLLAIESEAGAV